MHDFCRSFFSFPSLFSPLSPLFSIDGLGSLLILETGLGLPIGNRLGGVVVDGVVVGNGLGFSVDFGNGLGFADWKRAWWRGGMVVGNRLGFVDLSLDLPISTWWFADLGLGLPISAWVCYLQLGGVVVVTGGEKRKKKKEERERKKKNS